MALHGYIPLAEYLDRAREFYTTLVISDYSSTSEQDAVRFRLGGRTFRFSVDQFGVAMGFYTQIQVDRGDLVKLVIMEKKDVPN
ncbi:hypothetical protein LINGRAHAP2_LOCUS14577, partial [Linum grandiflorum]